ncbi:MAG: glycosyltransferase family 2 protein [Armatimonadetes bacterium]|nr:glycosyltransferase family 2 protein [Armatimonadota bacterium]
MERPTATIAAVVPAYNEVRRIRGVVDALKQAGSVDQLIVVSDGSTDGTYEAVKEDPRVEALQLPYNQGKAAAMYAGALRARADWLLFLDADLIGLTPTHVQGLLQPIYTGEADMSVGIFHGGRLLTDLSQYLAPSITGQRVVSRNFFLSLPDIQEVRYGVEMAIGFHARRRGLRIESVVLEGVTHPLKEEKLGPLQGSAARFRMYYEMGRYCMAATWQDVRHRSKSRPSHAVTHNRRSPW